MRLAIVRGGKVVTFVRSDTPPGWSPPSGTIAVPEADLPEGWEWETPATQDPPPLVPITKLTLKRRVTPTEWATITGAIAQNADTLENWNLATEIDPAHPETATMIDALTGAGLLTTPMHVIFAP